jgi:hypothetical protein
MGTVWYCELALRVLFLLPTKMRFGKHPSRVLLPGFFPEKIDVNKK